MKRACTLLEVDGRRVNRATESVGLRKKLRCEALVSCERGHVEVLGLMPYHKRIAGENVG